MADLLASFLFFSGWFLRATVTLEIFCILLLYLVRCTPHVRENIEALWLCEKYEESSWCFSLGSYVGTALFSSGCTFELVFTLLDRGEFYGELIDLIQFLVAYFLVLAVIYRSFGMLMFWLHEHEESPEWAQYYISQVYREQHYCESATTGALVLTALYLMVLGAWYLELG